MNSTKPEPIPKSARTVKPQPTDDELDRILPPLTCVQAHPETGIMCMSSSHPNPLRESIRTKYISRAEVKATIGEVPTDLDNYAGHVRGIYLERQRLRRELGLEGEPNG